MNIYIDIDGTLIHDGLHNFGQPAPYLKEFLQALNASGHDAYWLTTHCTDGNLTHLRQYLAKYLPEDVCALTNAYKPTVWHELKTEAIDFSQDFRWFDDDPTLKEREILRSKGVEDKLIIVDLTKNKGFPQISGKNNLF